MFRSSDGLVKVEVSNGMPATQILADFSIVNVPSGPKEAHNYFLTLWNSPTSKHVCLALSRHGRKERVSAWQNLQYMEAVGFSYLDTVSIWYERPNSCSNHGFLPVCETGHIFYKGTIPPDVKNTEWFGDGTSNATNLWNVSPQPDEKQPATYHQKFCWEIPLLLLSLAKPLEYRRFIYAAKLGENEYEPLFRFVKNFNMGVSLFATNDKEATHMIRSYMDVK